MSADYKVWSCKIVVRSDIDLPDGFDNPPRRAAIAAVEEALGDDAVLHCFSGWGGSLSRSEREFAKEWEAKHVR